MEHSVKGIDEDPVRMARELVPITPSVEQVPAPDRLKSALMDIVESEAEEQQCGTVQVWSS